LFVFLISGPATRPPALHLEDKAIHDCEIFLIDGIKSVEGNPQYNRPNATKSKSIVHLATILKAIAEAKSEPFIKFCDFLGRRLWKAITAGGVKLGNPAEAKVIKHLIALRVDADLRTLWRTLLGEQHNNIAQDSLLLYLIRYTYIHHW
jgi:hypothetical protein